MTLATSAKGRILIVDDDRAFRHAIGTLLEQAGHTVSYAADGPEAIGRLAGETVDLMLLDIGLPGMSGLDVLARVRTLAAAPRVVVVTADDTPETLLGAVRGQADRYVTKPFAPSAIVDVVEDVLTAAPAAALPIEVVSARPDWVEIVAPCSRQVADRIQAFMMQLEAGLPEAVRESVGWRSASCSATRSNGAASWIRRGRCGFPACGRGACCCTVSPTRAMGSTSSAWSTPRSAIPTTTPCSTPLSGRRRACVPAASVWRSPAPSSTS